MPNSWEENRKKIIGLGEDSFKKSYYPELQQKVEELESAKKNLETIFQNTIDGIIIHKLNGEILSINKPAQKLLNIDDGDNKSLNLLLIPSDNLSEPLNKTWEKALNGQPQIIEWRGSQVKTNKKLSLQISINKTIWDNQDALVAVLRDFKDRLIYEEELIRAKEKAEENDRLKSAFLANISHEIRTPMNGIVGFAELLKDKNLDDKDKNTFLSVVLRSSKRMLSTLNNIITVSQIESNQLKLYPSKFNINEVFNQLYLSFNDKIVQKNLKFKYTPPQNQLFVTSDREKLITILSNLLMNSIKYTDQGWIEMGCSQKNNQIHFYINDSGIGIPLKRQKAIFERFIQADIEDSEAREGTGLGLCIAQAYANLMGSEIKIKSEPQKGASFYFELLMG